MKFLIYIVLIHFATLHAYADQEVSSPKGVALDQRILLEDDTKGIV
jgi:hypothetical protein